MNNSIISRLNTLEKECGISEHSSCVLRLIRSGKYYDELSNEERNAYCKYLGFEREVYETINALVFNSLHFQLEKKRKPATREQFEENVKEVEMIVQGFVEEYNSPESKARREKEYEEMIKASENRH